LRKFTPKRALIVSFFSACSSVREVHAMAESWLRERGPCLTCSNADCTMALDAMLCQDMFAVSCSITSLTSIRVPSGDVRSIHRYLVAKSVRDCSVLLTLEPTTDPIIGLPPNGSMHEFMASLLKCACVWVRNYHILSHWSRYMDFHHYLF
jgi:hypothetical protein